MKAGHENSEGVKTTPQAAPHSLTFLYHELSTDPASYSYAVDCKDFATHLDLFTHLCRQGACIQPAISFDDGHISDYQHALPALASRGMSAHFFITVGWTGQRRGYMDWAQLRSLLAADQHIGAHGWSHTLLTHCTAQDLEKELGDARRALEDNLGAAITTMSLPGGRYNRKVLSACLAAGYTEVFTSIPRVEPEPHGFLVGRLNMRAGMDLTSIEQLMQPGSRSVKSLRLQYHLKQAAKALLGDVRYAKLWALLNRHNPDEEPASIAPL